MRHPSTVVAVLALCVGLSLAGPFDAITNAVNTATDAVGNAANTVGDTASDVASQVSSATDTAVNSVQGAVDTGTNAVSNAANTAVSSAQHTIDVSEHWIGNTANTVSNTVVNFTQDQWDQATGVADQVGSSISGVTGSAVSVGRQVGGQISDTANTVTGNGAPPPAGVNAADPAAILASFNGVGGFGPVATGILQGLAAGQAAQVADATAAVIVNATGNDTTQVQVAQAWATAMGIAQNDTAAVQVNATEVAEAFMASLQNAITPCASNLRLPTAPGSPEYTQAVVTGCCPVIDRTLSTEAMVTELIRVDAAFYSALQNSDAFGTTPQINLGRCITDNTEVS